MGYKILIIEDDPFVRKFYERVFSHQDFETSMAENGKDGFGLAKSFHPDLIYLDIMMPEMNGIEILKQLKSDPETMNISVVMLTNMASQEAEQSSMKFGASGFIIKSDVDVDQLVALTNGYLQSTKHTQ